MLSGIIGKETAVDRIDKNSTPPKSSNKSKNHHHHQHHQTKSDSTDSSPEVLKSKLIESMNNKHKRNDKGKEFDDGNVDGEGGVKIEM